MLVLDTRTISAADRGEAYQSSVSLNCTTSMAMFESVDTLWARIDTYDLGPAKVLNIDASGTTLRRTPRMARGMNECPIALALPMRTSNRLVWDREDRVFDRRDLILVDLSAPYHYGWRGDGASYAFHVDFDRLDLPMDLIRAAMLDLRRSPIYSLVRDHIAHVMTDAASVVESGAAGDVGAASVELMRALIVSAADDSRRLNQAMHTSLPQRVQAYVRHHVRDPELSPAKIANANAISVRELYRIYESLGVSLERSITDERLRGAHAELASRAARSLSIAAVAGSWGFSSPSFFASRFKERFGVTPRQWRDAAGRLAASTTEEPASASDHTIGWPGDPAYPSLSRN